MSNSDKTLKETVAEALKGNNDTSKSEAAETNKGISGNETEGETQSGGTPEYVSGIDISDIPDQDRTRFKELFSKKAKLLEDGYTQKFKEVGELKRALAGLTQMGLSVQDVEKALTDYAANKGKTTASEKKEAGKILDKLMADAQDAEQREAYSRLRAAIKEESDYPTLRKELDDIKSSLGLYRQTFNTQREKEVDSELSSLSEKFGNELIEKYSDVIRGKAIQYPNMSVSKIFQIEVPFDEIEQAFLTKGKKPLTDEKKKANSTPSSGITSANEKVDVSKSSFADLLKKGFAKA